MVDALIDDWAGCHCRPHSPVVWSVNHGKGDISWLMQRAIADSLWSEIASDNDMRGIRLRDDEATHANFFDALARSFPGLVVTTATA